ncbi:hypothetical protein [Sphingobium baderi]|uniref:Uncharacterized protein n=1 Tax=Sphingobium baderi LL03 TaxID=1114964 RepID=T0G8D0_9SPHN|nr:hypothetical protein [Sphingobium baderi]EQA96881.1 hypothetical protein L485_22640 [Sphingobium baderi LL03]KMS64087.1 hypothetical protein V475_20160 [Sphingobium baderi LL03]
MSRYASTTSVSSAKSKAEIEALVERYGAAQFASGWSADQAVVGFTMHGRQIKFVLTMPDKNRREFTHHSKGARTADAALAQWEQACRSRWRALLLVIKAKLEAVESGISVFEDEFMANIVLPDGQLVGQWMRPQIADAYESRAMPPLLPHLGKGE